MRNIVLFAKAFVQGVVAALAVHVAAFGAHEVAHFLGHVAGVIAVQLVGH